MGRAVEDLEVGVDFDFLRFVVLSQELSGRPWLLWA